MAAASPSGSVALSAKPASGPGGPLGPSYDTKTPQSVSLSGAGANSINPFFEKVFTSTT